MDPGFEVLTEPHADRLFDRAFRDWFQRQLESPSEAVRRALRRLPPAWSSYGDDEDGPVAKLRAAGKQLLQWRDLRAPWRREPFDRDAEVKRCADELCAFADLTARSRGAAIRSTRRPRRSVPSPRTSVAPGTRRTTRAVDLDGWEALLIRTSKEFKDIRTRPPGRVRQGRDARGRARREGRARVAARPVRRARRRRSRRAAAAGAARVRRSLRRPQDPRRRPRLPRPPPPRARPGARLRARPPRLPGAVQVHPRRRVPGHRSAAGGDPGAARGTRGRLRG